MADEGIPDLFSWSDAGGNTHTLSPDVTIEFSDTRETELTSNVVEKGSPVTDHLIHKPGRIQLSIAQTQTPIVTSNVMAFAPITIKFAPARATGMIAIAVGALKAIGSAVGLKLSPDDHLDLSTLQAGVEVDRVAELHDQLIDIQANGFPCTVIFKGRRYPQFLITSLILKHNRGEFGLGRFDLQMGEFRTVSTDTAVLPPAKSLRDTGKKASKSDENGGHAKDTSLRSYWKEGTDFAGVTDAGDGL